MLSDQEIKDAVKNGEIAIEREYADGRIQEIINQQGKNLSDGSLQSHGYDLRIRAVRWSLDEGWKELCDEPGWCVYLLPGKTVDVKTLERIRLSNGYGATIHSMVRMRKIGLSAIATTIHPHWGSATEGLQHLEITITNLGKLPIRLEYDESFCRVLFHKLGKDATLPEPAWQNIEKPYRRQHEASIEQQQAEEKAKQEKQLRRAKRKRLLGVILASILLFIGIAAGVTVLSLPFARSNTVLGSFLATLILTIMSAGITLINHFFGIVRLKQKL